MICQYCKQPFEHDHVVIVLNGKLFHEVECLVDYVIENLAEEEGQTYLEYLENLARGE